MGFLHNDTLSGLVNGEASNLNSVLILNRLHERGFTNNLYKLFASISVLIHLTDISRSQRLVQGDVDGQVNATEPRGAELLSVSGHKREKRYNIHMWNK